MSSKQRYQNISYNPTPSGAYGIAQMLNSIGSDSRANELHDLQLQKLQYQAQRDKINDAAQTKKNQLELARLNLADKRMQLVNNRSDQEWKQKQQDRTDLKMLEQEKINSMLGGSFDPQFRNEVVDESSSNIVTDVDALNQNIKQLPEIEQYQNQDKNWETYKKFEEIGSDKENKGDEEVIAKKRIDWLKNNRKDEYDALNRTGFRKFISNEGEQKVAPYSQYAEDFVGSVGDFFNKPELEKVLEKPEEGKTEIRKKIKYFTVKNYSPLISNNSPKASRSS